MIVKHPTKRSRARTGTLISRMCRIHLIEHHFYDVSYWKEENISVHKSDVGIVVSSNVVYADIALNHARNIAITRINTDKCRYGVILALQGRKDQHGLSSFSGL